jgi:ferredoxin
MSKLIVDQNKCQGYGVCVSICPKLFQLNKEGKSEVINQDYSGSDYERAIASCPTQAISIKED